MSSEDGADKSGTDAGRLGGEGVTDPADDELCFTTFFNDLLVAESPAERKEAMAVCSVPASAVRLTRCLTSAFLRNITPDLTRRLFPTVSAYHPFVLR